MRGAYLKRLTNLAVVLMAVFFAAATASAETAAELVAKGDALYARRAEGSSGDWAKPDIIGQCVESYLKAREAGDDSTELAVKIMRASYFYGTYAERDSKKQMEIFERSIRVGEEALKADPNSVALNYQMAGAWGRWGEVFGIIASARKGVAQNVRNYGEKTVALDQQYAEAGGYRTLGRLHFKAPRIPIVLSWPSKDESARYLARAVEIGPDNLANHLFYAETLYELGKYPEAMRQVDFVLSAPVHPDKRVEDERDRKDASALKALVAKRLK